MNGQVHIHRHAQFVLISGPVEVTQTSDDMGSIFSSVHEMAKLLAFGRGRVVLKKGPEQGAMAEHQSQRVIKIVGDAASHHAQGAQTLLFHELLLGGGQASESVFELPGALGDEALQGSVLPLQLHVQKPCLKQVADSQKDLMGIQRLSQKILGSLAQRALPSFRGDIRCENQNGQIFAGRKLGLNLGNERKAIDVGHVEIQQNDVRLE